MAASDPYLVLHTLPRIRRTDEELTTSVQDGWIARDAAFSAAWSSFVPPEQLTEVVQILHLFCYVPEMFVDSSRFLPLSYPPS